MSRITELVLGGTVAPWERLGLPFEQHTTSIGSVRMRVDPIFAPGLVSVGVDEILDGVVVDGAPVHVAAPVAPDTPGADTLGAVRIDHVVLMTPDLERTIEAVTTTLGVPLKRIREAGPVRQGFFRLGEVILELVTSARVPAGPATWWGFVIDVADLAATCERLGPDVVGPPRPAVQPGRLIASIREDVGHGVPVALMSV